MEAWRSVDHRLGSRRNPDDKRNRLSLTVSRRSPLQGPHCFDRIGCRIAHPARNRLVVEAIHVLLRRNAESRGFAAKQGEFASRDVGAYLLDHSVMIDQGFGDPAIKRWLRQIAQADFPRPPFPAGIVQGTVNFGIGIRFWFLCHCHGLHCSRRCVALDAPIPRPECPIMATLHDRVGPTSSVDIG
jgi:hypothetical protein